MGCYSSEPVPRLIRMLVSDWAQSVASIYRAAFVIFLYHGVYLPSRLFAVPVWLVQESFLREEFSAKIPTDPTDRSWVSEDGSYWGWTNLVPRFSLPPVSLFRSVGTGRRNPGNEVGVAHETRDKGVARGRRVVERVGLVGWPVPFADVLCRSAEKRNERCACICFALSAMIQKKCDTHVYTSFFHPLIRRKQLGDWPNA